MQNVPSKRLLMIFYYIHRSVFCSSIIREASSCSKWEQVQRPKARQYAESESETLGHSTSPRGSGNFAGSGKSVKVKGNERHQEVKAF